jgi:hypothetical protein
MANNNNNNKQLTKSISTYLKIHKPEILELEKSKTFVGFNTESNSSFSSNSNSNYNSNYIYLGHYGFYYIFRYDKYTKHIIKSITKNVVKTNNKKIIISNLLSKKKQFDQNLLFINYNYKCMCSVLNYIQYIELHKKHNNNLISDGMKHDVGFDENKNLTIKNNDDYLDKVLINFKYTFIMKDIPLTLVTAYYRSLVSIFQLVIRNKSDMIKNYKNVCAKMLDFYNYSNNFYNKYSHILHHNNVLPFILNTHDDYIFLVELINLYKLMITTYTDYTNFNRTVSINKIKKFNNLVKNNFPQHIDLNIYLNIKTDIEIYK